MSSPWLSFSIMTTMMCGTVGVGVGTGALFGAVATLARVADGRVGASCRFADGADVPGEAAVEELTAGGADVGAESGGGGEVTDVTDVTGSCGSVDRSAGAGVNTNSEISPNVRPVAHAEPSATRRLERRRRCFALPRDRCGDTVFSRRGCRACRAVPWPTSFTLAGFRCRVQGRGHGAFSARAPLVPVKNRPGRDWTVASRSGPDIVSIPERWAPARHRYGEGRSCRSTAPRGDRGPPGWCRMFGGREMGLFDQGSGPRCRRGMRARPSFAFGAALVVAGLVTATGGAISAAAPARSSQNQRALSDPTAGHAYRHGAVPLRISSAPLHNTAGPTTGTTPRSAPPPVPSGAP